MSRKPKALWEPGYNGHVYWLGKKKLGKVIMGPVGEALYDVLVLFNGCIYRNKGSKPRPKRQGFEGGLKCRYAQWDP